MIQLKGVTKKYAGVIAVSDVTMQIAKKERIAVLGHSGCGKTTLLRLIAGLERPDSGEIYINGMKANNPDIVLAPDKRSVGMIFQDLALWPYMTVSENVGFGLENAIPDKTKIDVCIKEALEMVHLRNKACTYPGQLSGGEQQRVALARALIRSPNILLMDEPLAHLDQKLKEEMISLIRDLQEYSNATLVYVTHDEYTARRLAGRVYVMNQGRIVHTKASDEVSP